MSEYAERDVIELEPHFSRHVSAMTAEGLHSKSSIAAELAYRDERIADLEHHLREYAKRANDFEALARDRGAEIEAMRHVVEDVCALLTSRDDRIADLEHKLFSLGAMEEAPCFCCGYNGPGYYDPEKHTCAARHHEARKPK